LGPGGRAKGEAVPPPKTQEMPQAQPKA
jgi:hypothetical protein